ncbi:carboxylating nicotinate-nucleotide diphosphorylase [Simiduia agarivorans]|uniref:Probable nicotinate-nucleotide pyrophosphorylase [carboxylating] n=1 Tax=Simiduia agarivorans (strain DSM 21679 / JCM 13881 / BCRC 17597 / SA1) TaxID=1117647 RepID=K4KRF5_SIMAS|nr:carboxylating nicotinate-nucleotide diphosphorylase [Simiduia agarivorans]AFV00714.1 nicotinate-nucleotide pyrophosphorylase [Simiduia agarivorans SA1 = DSM 21679]
MLPDPLAQQIAEDRIRCVTAALQEDVGSGDITAQLIPAGQTASARVITREACTVAGSEWVNEVFRQLDPSVTVTWHVQDGERAQPNQLLYELSGNARSLMTGERAALNFLQMLSGVATTCREYADLVAHTQVKLLDTRKTIPGLRTAQKYAVTCGGCHNHRIGLYDAFLIKENHIMACGGIQQAIASAHTIAPGKPVEIEVETLEEFQAALDAGADIIMLDEFDKPQTIEAVNLRNNRRPATKIEASGGISKDNLGEIASWGADFISIGALTKHARAVDLSMRVIS